MAQSLKRFEGGGHHKEIGFSHRGGIVGEAAGDERTHPAVVQVTDVIVAVARGGGEGEEERIGGGKKRAGVDEQVTDGAVGVERACGGGYDVGYSAERERAGKQ